MSNDKHPAHGTRGVSQPASLKRPSARDKLRAREVPSTWSAAPRSRRNQDYRESAFFTFRSPIPLRVTVPAQGSVTCQIVSAQWDRAITLTVGVSSGWRRPSCIH
eukprot:6295156-Prymnesium_polylepis.1